MSRLSVITVAFLAFTLVNPAKADTVSSIGITLCAAIVACDDNGIVAYPYKDGPCAAEIQKRCDIISSVKAHNAQLVEENRILAEKLIAVEKSLRRTQKELAKRRRS